MMTSATPTPSEPGNHAATNASEAFNSGLTHIARPLINMDTTGIPWSCNDFNNAKSVLLPG